MPDVEIYVPLALEPYALTQHGSRALTVLAGLKPGIDLIRARAELHTIARELEKEYPEANTGWDVAVFPLHEEMVAGIRPALLAYKAKRHLLAAHVIEYLAHHAHASIQR